MGRVVRGPLNARMGFCVLTTIAHMADLAQRGGFVLVVARVQKPEVPDARLAIIVRMVGTARKVTHV
jgi:hypothetical protein